MVNEEIIKLVTPVVVIVIYLFFYSKRYNIFPIIPQLLILSIALFSSNFQWIYRILGQGIILLFILYAYFYKKYKLKTDYSKIFLCFLCFIFVSYIGNAIVKDSYVTSILNYISITLTVIPYVQICKQNVVKREVFRLFEFLGICLSIVAFVEYFATSSRVEVTFSNSNYLSFFLIVSLICSCSLYSKNKKIYRLLYVLIMLIGIILTGSRTTFLLSILAILFLLFNSKNFLKFLLPAAFVYIVCLPLFSEILQSRYKSISDDASVDARIEIFETSKNIIRDHPINGIGYAQFSNQYKKYLPVNTGFSFLIYSYDEIVTHNDFLRIIDELGCIAFLISLYFIVSLFVHIIKNEGLNNFYFCMLFIICIFSFTHNNLNSFLPWFFIALISDTFSKKNI